MLWIRTYYNAIKYGGRMSILCALRSRNSFRFISIFFFLVSSNSYIYFSFVSFSLFSTIDLLIFRFIIIIINTCARHELNSCVYFHRRRSIVHSLRVCVSTFIFILFVRNGRAFTNFTFSFSFISRQHFFWSLFIFLRGRFRSVSTSITLTLKTNPFVSPFGFASII